MAHLLKTVCGILCQNHSFSAQLRFHLGNGIRFVTLDPYWKSSRKILKQLPNVFI